MKRQKRDRLERAHQRGYQAGIAGRSKEMCPYQTLNQRSQWLGGWREAIVTFALVVIMTMFSAMTFDPRLSWDRQPESEHEES